MSTKAAVEGASNTKQTRGQRIWARQLDLRGAPMSVERGRLITASYKETEGWPHPIRRAKAVEKILTEIPIYIDDEQLLVGDYAAYPMAIEWHPESYGEFVLQEIEAGEYAYPVRDEDMPVIREVHEYWKDKSVRGSFSRVIGKERAQRYKDVGEEGAFIYALFGEIQDDKAWYVPDYPKAIRKGFSGILAEVEQELEATPMLDEASQYKIYFLQALAIVLKAGIQYSRRYAALAREMAKKERGKRKAELEKLAEVCEWIPENPARTFYEALQTMWLVTVMIWWDHRAFGTSQGRVDQYLYPYYQRDIEEGRMTREEALDLLECFRIKPNAKRKFASKFKREFGTGEAEFFNCTLGGQTADGKDATNDLSFLWLEAAIRTQTPHPTLSIRMHDGISPDFLMKAAELCSLGLGFPAWFNDKSFIPYLLKMGATLEEARDYALSGCVIPAIQGKMVAYWMDFESMPKALELALNNGLDPHTRKQIGPQTGKFEDFKTYEEFYEAYKKQVEFFARESARGINEARFFRTLMVPQITASCFFDDCIKRGLDSNGGGCRYQGYHSIVPVGTSDAVNSLAVIKKYVYEEGKVGKQELLDALEANFEGKDNLRQLFLSAPKLGNDDDYVDNIAAGLVSWMVRMVDTIDAPYGTKYVLAPWSVAVHGATGRRVKALPSGRLAGVALADGGVSPTQGSDVNGPTAVINSLGKIDQLPLLTALLNMKFSPSALKTKDDLRKFLALIKTYFDYGGKHIQFNVVRKETLLDAQAHPENYRGLIVRVAGYSALWNELDRIVQDEIIGRAEHVF